MEGVSIARHVWLYLLTLISLGILAAGIGQLLTLLFDVTIRSSYISSIGNRPFDLERLARGLAMTLLAALCVFILNSARPPDYTKPGRKQFDNPQTVSFPW
jgi:hypothetical protein